MFPSRLIRTRLGRPTAASVSGPRMQFRTSYSTSNPSSSTSSLRRRTRRLALACAIAVPCVWWLPNTGNIRVYLVHDTSGEVPVLKTVSSPLGEILSGPSRDDVTRGLSGRAYSLHVDKVPGVSRYDGSQVASNSPCEDRFTHGLMPSPRSDNRDWMVWGIFDGHAGWQTAFILESELAPHVRAYLEEVIGPKAGPGRQVSDELVQAAIKQSFVDLDAKFLKAAADVARGDEQPLQDKVVKATVAHTGSCALLSLYDPVSSTLHVACTGDSRAVLGQQGPDGKWEAVPLSVDQTGTNAEEVARINSEHPGEEGGIVKDGRVLGIMVSRAFGDARWKLPLDLQEVLAKRFHGDALLAPKYPCLTPPYLTAEPVVTSVKIDPSRPSFLIMASDGLWDSLSNQQAVDLVGKWVATPAKDRGRPSTPEPGYGPFDFSQMGKEVSWEFEDSRTTVEDDNAAVHLTRNSLGGNHHELVAGKLALAAPKSRHVRDDITVQVVFFNSKV